MVRVAIVADDLTGALDSVGPFVSHGFSAVVATAPGQLVDALRQPCDVVAVSTGSRELAGGEAAERVAFCTRLIAETPALPVKKIDSRLKGNIEAELLSMMAVLGRRRVVVAPAIPELGRFVSGRHVAGAGIARPIAIAERLGRLRGQAEIPDCPDDAALLRVAQGGLAAHTLLAGATGLTQAIARTLGGVPRDLARFMPASPIAFVIGSRDPITLRQVAYLRRTYPDIGLIEAPDGQMESHRTDSARGDLVLLATAGGGSVSPAEVADRLAEAAARLIDERGIAVVFGAGGETVSALLDRLGIALVRPRGEVLRGIPWSEGVDGAGRPFTIVTKSGGFGEEDTLAAMLDR